LKAGTLKYTGNTPVDESTKKFNLPAYNVTVSAQFENLPGLIGSAADFAKIGTPGYPLDGNYELTANINLPSGWTPIGSGTAPFTGAFDGRGRSITISSFPSNGINISAAPAMVDFSNEMAGWNDPGPNGDIIARGLFAYTENAVIKDLDITVNASFVITPTGTQQTQFFGTVAAAAVNTAFTGINISGGVLSVDATSVDMLMLGGIAGLMVEGGSMIDCTVNVKIQASLDNSMFCSVIGGLVGQAGNSNITGCSMAGDVEVSGGSDNEIGGLASNTRGPVRNSFVSGNVSAVSAYGGTTAGGLVARNIGIIENCYVTGNVSAESTASGGNVEAGGLVAILDGEDDGNTNAVKKSYSIGAVSAISKKTATAGGIAATIYDENTEISDCYSTGNVSANGGTGSDGVRAGGIAGNPQANKNAFSVTITRCYASGTISVDGSGSNKTVGGIAGNANAQSGGSGSITNCAALSGPGSITCEGSGTAKRIVGSTNFSLNNNIANDAMSGSSNGSGQDGEDKSSSDLALEATYIALGWDFSTVWKMSGDSPSRPILKWQ
jgi:hypothetical protein